MPFTIGKVFSDESLALLQRKQEEERQAALELQRLQLQRAGMVNESDRANRELDLRASSMQGEDADRAIRRQIALNENARQNRALDLNAREQAFREKRGEFDMGFDREKFDEQKSQFGIESGQRNRQLDIGERTAAENEAEGKFNREEKFPTEAGLKAMEIERKSAADDDRARKFDAEIESLKARTNLTNETAKTISERNGWSSYDRAQKELGALTRAYDAAANGINGPNEPMKAEIEQRIKSMLAVISAADETMYRTIMKNLGPQLSASMGEKFSPFGKTGYGAAGDIYKSMLEGFGKSDAPPKGK